MALKCLSPPGEKRDCGKSKSPKTAKMAKKRTREKLRAGLPNPTHKLDT
jgi:hypothetical protein